MAKSKTAGAKIERLQEQGVLHRRAEDVTDELFRDCDFLDPHDLLQVKYEMLRRVRIDQCSVSTAAQTFGLSRVSYYEIQTAWERDGLAGLLPKKRGPHGGHKLTDEIVLYLMAQHTANPSLKLETLVERVKAQFNVDVHPRSINRVLQRGKKNSAE